MRDACRSERDQKRQRSLGPVSGGAERVQAENRNTRQWADPFGSLIRRGQRFSKQRVEEGHSGLLYAGTSSVRRRLTETFPHGSFGFTGPW